MGSTISTITGSGTQDHEYYRKAAREQAVIRGEYIEKSRAAYQAGNGALAKDLSLKAKRYAQEMDRFNVLAKQSAFQTFNAHRPSNELDLHGLLVREALEVTRERLDKFTRNKEKELTIIVGRGNNSMNGVAKIKPAVTELVQEFNIKATPNKPNPGCIFIEPRPAGEAADSSWADGFFRSLFGLIRSFFR